MGEMENFMFGRNTFAMFVPIEMSEDRTCKTQVIGGKRKFAFHHTPVLMRTFATRRGYRVIPQCRAWYVTVSCAIGSVSNLQLGFDSPIA